MQASSLVFAAMRHDPLESIRLRNLPRNRPVAIGFAVLFGGTLSLLTVADTEAQNRDELRPPPPLPA